MTKIRTYRGIEVTQSYSPSNFAGTNDFFCIINGKIYRSPSWDNLKKTIKKTILKNHEHLPNILQ